MRLAEVRLRKLIRQVINEVQGTYLGKIPTSKSYVVTRHNIGDTLSDYVNAQLEFVVGPLGESGYEPVEITNEEATKSLQFVDLYKGLHGDRDLEGPTYRAFGDEPRKGGDDVSCKIEIMSSRMESSDELVFDVYASNESLYDFQIFVKIDRKNRKLVHTLKKNNNLRRKNIKLHDYY